MVFLPQKLGQGGVGVVGEHELCITTRCQPLRRVSAAFRIPDVIVKRE